jgi:hypothetical protein
MICYFLYNTFFQWAQKMPAIASGSRQIRNKNLQIRNTGGPLKGKVLNLYMTRSKWRTTAESLKGNPPQE